MLRFKIIAIFGFTLSIAIFVSNFAFAGSSPRWNKSTSGSTYNIYKTIIACGKEFGHLCKKFEEPMGNIYTPKKIMLKDKIKPLNNNLNDANFNTTFRRKFYVNVHSDFDVEKNAPKNKIMAERYYEFLESRAKVAEYQRRNKTFGSH